MGDTLVGKGPVLAVHLLESLDTDWCPLSYGLTESHASLTKRKKGRKDTFLSELAPYQMHIWGFLRQVHVCVFQSKAEFE